MRRSKIRKRSSRRGNISDADVIVAATAGVNNWKTWAGRSHGTDDFERLDLFRGMKRRFLKRFVTGLPRPGTVCPVCLCDPASSTEDGDDDNGCGGWHITSSCAHAVCHGCLTAYASSQVKDVEHYGPLKCPVCPQPLRRSDAIVALRADTQLIRLWDLKIRNQFLRALPAYRSCPHCSNNNNNNTNTNANNNDTDTDQSNQNSSTGDGGGFVTPKCLAPHHEARRNDAASRLMLGKVFTILSVSALFTSTLRYILKTPSPSPTVDIFFTILSIYLLFGKIGLFARRHVTLWARHAFFRPITVECPCCDLQFILPAQSRHLEDEETETWISANSRRCPSCSVPITRSGGCNHMRCSHCRASFCWACMRLGTTCGAFLCAHGAPYNDAVQPVDATAAVDAPAGQRLGINSLILARIDYILDRGTMTLEVYDGIIFLVALFARDTWVIQTFIGGVMFLITCFFNRHCIMLFILSYMLVRSYRSLLRTDIMNNETGMSEQERIDRATLRSIHEQ